MKPRLFRTLCVVIATTVLVCIPQASFAGAGHGGGGGFHGGGGGFGGGGFHGGGGGFHGAGVGGFHGAAGWHGAPGWGWRGGWGWPGGWGWRGGWGYPYWGWGWGVNVSFGVGWGWGGSWPYYAYPYAYYPYYPYYPYYAPYAYPPPPPSQDPGRYNRSPQDPGDNSQRQNSYDPPPTRFPSTNVVTIKAPRVATPSSNYRTVAAVATVPRQQVQNVIRALEAMPPEARRRQIESGRYNNFTPDEQELIRRVVGTSTVAATVRY